MEIVGTLFQILLAVYLLGGLGVSIYSILFERNLSDEPLFGIKFLGNYYFYSGAFFALWLMLAEGTQTLLFFIPDTWGSVDEYGDWTSVREYWSGFIALFISGAIFWYIGNAEEAKKKQREQNIKN